MYGTTWTHLSIVLGATMPDNSGEEDCVEAQKGGWNDFDCDKERPLCVKILGELGELHTTEI